MSGEREAPPAKRKPLPRHIVKQILAAIAEYMQAVPPWLQEMDDRPMAAIEARRRAAARAKAEEPAGELEPGPEPEVQPSPSRPQRRNRTCQPPGRCRWAR